MRSVFYDRRNGQWCAYHSLLRRKWHYLQLIEQGQPMHHVRFLNEPKSISRMNNTAKMH